MLDRILIIVLVLFLATGGFMYEKYATEKGDVGPIGRLVDFTKFGKTSDLFQSTSSRKIFKYNSQASLIILREKHNRLENQRAQLVLNRRELLSQLDKINDQIIQEALGYNDLIEADRDRFLERFPELREIGGAIIHTYKIPDPATREERYQVIRRTLEDLIQEFAKNRPAELAHLNEVIEELDQAVDQEKANDKFDELEKNLKTFSGKILDSAHGDIEKMVKMTNDLREQYKSLGENLDVNDQQIEANNELMGGKLKTLAENLISASEEDLKKVVEAYVDVQKQQEILLENLALHQDRVREIQNENDRHTQEIMKDLQAVPRFDFGKLSRTHDLVRSDRSELFAKFEDNEFRFRRVIREQWTDNGNLLTELVQNAPSDGSRLMEDRKYAERRSVNSRLNLLSSDNHSLRNFERNNDLKSGSNNTRIEPLRSIANPLNNRKREEANEQFKRLKDKAYDQGLR